MHLLSTVTYSNAWEINEGMRQKASFCYFFIWGCFGCQWMRVGETAQKISFVFSFSFLVLLKKIRMRDRTTPSLVFTLSGTLHHYKSYRKNLRNQHQREQWVHGLQWLHPRHVINSCTTTLPPLKTTCHVYLPPPPEVHSLTTPSSKQKQLPKEEYHSKTIIFHFTITTITLMTTTSHVTFTYPINTPTTSSTNIHAFIHFPYHISNNGCGATGHHPAKAERDRYTHYLLKTTILITILYIFLIQLSHCIYLI